MPRDKGEKGKLGQRNRQFEGGNKERVKENEGEEDRKERDRKGDLTCQEQCY